MKPSTALSKLAVAGMLLYAAGRELLQPRPGAGASEPRPNTFALILKTVIYTLAIGALSATVGMLLFVMSGVYDLKAVKPHTAPVEWLLQTMKTRAVQFHSRAVRVPDLRGESLLKNGFGLYRTNCQPCHGAPGVAAQQIGRGINPKPPVLTTASANWSDAELFWITSEGLKMSGMPAFGTRLSNRDRWGLVAFVRRLDRLSPAEYQNMSAAADQGMEAANWGDDDRQGFSQLRRAHAERGPELVYRYGCSACHIIPEAGWGLVGPPLSRFAERQYIAGTIVNLPTNAVNWIIDPKKYKPQTAMPRLGVKRQDAMDLVAYLYSFGDSKRIQALQQHRRQ